MNTEIIDALTENDFDFEPELNGELERFDRDGSGNAWFVGHETEHGIVAWYGDWRTGESHEYSSDTKEMEPSKRAAFNKKRAALKRNQKAGEKDKWAAAREVVTEVWAGASDGVHPYLTNKKLGAANAYGCRIRLNRDDTKTLLVPVSDNHGIIWSLQKIDEQGNKQFQQGGKIKGGYHIVGDISKRTEHILLCEGLATAGTLYEATKLPVVVAFNAGNMSAVAQIIKKLYLKATVIICGDDDRFNEKVNIGRVKAEKAAQLIRSYCVFPEFHGIASTGSDFNDLCIEESLDEVKKQITIAVEKSSIPIIGTQATGFHDVEWVRGNDIYTPNYEDLRCYFEGKHYYKVLGQGKMVYSWEGTHYRDFNDCEIDNFAQKYFDPICDNRKAAEFRGILYRTNYVALDWFGSSTKKKVNFKNGRLCLRSGVFEPGHSTELGFRYCLDYDYVVGAECPIFDKMLAAVCCGDVNQQNALLEFMGYALSHDDCWIHKALVLVGEGENGKSTFIRALKGLANESNYTSLTLEELKKDTNRYMLDGKGFNIAGETPKRALLDSSLFKALIAGDEVQAKRLYKDAYTMVNRAKFIFACNELPESWDTSQGFFRRLLIVPFGATFVKGDDGFDAHIDLKIESERAGIFNRAMEGYRRLVDQGEFSESGAMRAVMAEYRDDVDYSRVWVKDNLVEEKEAELSFIEIYLAYSNEMDRGNLKVLNKNKFGRLLKTCFALPKNLPVKRVDQAPQRMIPGVNFNRGE